MSELRTITDIRDIVVIVFAISAVVTFFVVTVFTVLIGLQLVRLLRYTNGTVRDGVGPILENAQEAARSVQGTTNFISESLVSPIIRVYSVFSGVRRGFGVLTRAGGRSGGKGSDGE